MEDIFDVELFMDPVYRTVVFKTVAGQSRCPHEQGTAPREKFKLEFADGLTDLTVFSKGEGEVSFPMYILNESPLKEDLGVFIYIIPSTNSFDPETNAGGDVFIVTNNGIDGLNNGYSLPPIGYGRYGKIYTAIEPPLAKNTANGRVYEDLEITLYSQCEVSFAGVAVYVCMCVGRGGDDETAEIAVEGLLRVCCD